MPCPHNGFCSGCGSTAPNMFETIPYDTDLWIDSVMKVDGSPQAAAYWNAKIAFHNFNPYTSHKSKWEILATINRLQTDVHNTANAVLAFGKQCGVY